MSDLISRKEAIDILYNYKRMLFDGVSDPVIYGVQGAIEVIKTVPCAVSVGEWIWHEDEDICNCSECEFEIDATGCIEPMEYVGVFRYCPNCGAKMDGERKTND